MVQKGVFNYYILTCTFQAGWTFAFCFEIIWLSVIFILLIWISLVALLYSQYYVAVKDDESNRTLCEFWFLRFPFAIHCGWLTAASALNINVFVVDLNAAADIQLAVGIISLAVLHAISVWVIFGVRKANYTIAGVLSWANYWIYEELQDPKDSIIDLFAAETISGVSYAGLAVSIIILVQIVTRIAWDVYQNFCRGDDSTEDEKESLVSTSNKEGASIPVKIEPTDNV